MKIVKRGKEIEKIVKRIGGKRVKIVKTPRNILKNLKNAER